MKFDSFPLMNPNWIKIDEMELNLLIDAGLLKVDLPFLEISRLDLRVWLLNSAFILKVGAELKLKSNYNRKSNNKRLIL